MFSSRTEWNRQPNRLTKLLEERRRDGKRILDLTLSNPTEAGFSYPEKEILSALSGWQSSQYTPEPRGLPQAREAIAGYYAERGIDIDPSDIILTAGTSEAYAHIFMLLCEPGENVLVPSPSYPLFEFLARLHDVTLREYKLRYDGEWHIDVDSLAHAADNSTKAIVVVSPHNPTGMILKKKELEMLHAIASGRKLALLVDEVFADYVFTNDPGTLRSTAAHDGALTFTLNGISKSCGLPHLKLGWIVVSGGDEVKREAFHRLEIIADTFLSVNQPVQAALPELLVAGASVKNQIRARTSGNLAFLQSHISKNSSLSLLLPEGGWYAILRVPNTRTEEEWALRLLGDSGVYVFPGYFFEFQQSGYLVLSLLPERTVFEEGVNLIVQSVG